ncbi:hypothetical protein BJY24_001235 [Nocardia transvalensis]|uniref:DinB-like domain-containing protein n=1 Tax=Nocardia transvalensis TaxID=37333 RepID=A0A7W9PAV2_9NOCA|nr:DinB family protein [Nocardia transvalensis]MBB5912368.1 hypothetical protein [Nocardia transvalensis]
MSVSRPDLLRWQFDMTWALLELHLRALTPEDYRWEPAPLVWTVRPGPGGVWIPDWSETEPDPIPVPTIAWLTWHIGWWWSVTLDHARGHAVRDRTEIGWPGEAEVAGWLYDLRADWRAVLDAYTDADLDAPAAFPWGDTPDRTVAHTAAWVNAELMKNAAEIGQLRLLRAAG